MRAFLVESLLPLLGICALVVGLTLALFDVPGHPSMTTSAAPVAPEALAAPRVAAPKALPGALSTPEETLGLPRDAPTVRDRLSEVLGQAMRQIGPRKPRTTGVPGFGSNPAVPGGPSAPAEPMPDPGLLGAVTALGDAVKAIHEARSDEDIVRAEESVRGAREKMEAACQAGGTGAPLCAGAAQIRSLGY